MATKRAKKTKRAASKSDTTSKRGSRAVTRSAPWKPRFIEALRETANVRAACDIAGIARSTAYKQREEDSDFGDQWGNAMEDAVDALALEARSRAMNGSDKLIQFLLIAHRPQVYSPRIKLGGDGSQIGIDAKLSMADMMRSLRHKEQSSIIDVTPDDEY